MNTGPQGQSLDITMYMRDPIKNLITYAARESEGKKFGLEMNMDGDYEVCFSNRYRLRSSYLVVPTDLLDQFDTFQIFSLLQQKAVLAI